MSFDLAAKAITQRFINEWGVTTPFTFENEKFSEPNVNWVRLTIRNTVGVQETLGRSGNRKYNRQGSVIAQIFTNADTGRQPADLLAQQFVDIFEGETFDYQSQPFSNVFCNNSATREAGNDGKWFMMISEIFFFYEEIK